MTNRGSYKAFRILSLRYRRVKRERVLKGKVKSSKVLMAYKRGFK